MVLVLNVFAASRARFAQTGVNTRVCSTGRVAEYEYVVEVVMYGVGLLASLCLEHHARETYASCALANNVIAAQAMYCSPSPCL